MGSEAEGAGILALTKYAASHAASLWLLPNPKSLLLVGTGVRTPGSLALSWAAPSPTLLGRVTGIEDPVEQGLELHAENKGRTKIHGTWRERVLLLHPSG